MARPPDVPTPLVGEKHVSPTIEALNLTLHPPRARGQRRQIGIVGNDHKHIDVLRIRLAEVGDRVVVTAGVPFDRSGTTNLVKVETV